jgi:hypothetical protein
MRARVLLERAPGAGNERGQQQLRAGAQRPQRQPRAPRRYARHVGEAERIAGRALQRGSGREAAWAPDYIL